MFTTFNSKGDVSANFKVRKIKINNPNEQTRPSLLKFVGISPRSRNGCLECKKRKKRCDENKPKCNLCQKRDIECTYTVYNPKNNTSVYKIINALASKPEEEKEKKLKQEDVLINSHFLSNSLINDKSLPILSVGKPLNNAIISTFSNEMNISLNSSSSSSFESTSDIHAVSNSIPIIHSLKICSQNQQKYSTELDNSNLYSNRYCNFGNTNNPYLTNNNSNTQTNSDSTLSTDNDFDAPNINYNSFYVNDIKTDTTNINQNNNYFYINNTRNNNISDNGDNCFYINDTDISPNSKYNASTNSNTISNSKNSNIKNFDNNNSNAKIFKNNNDDNSNNINLWSIIDEINGANNVIINDDSINQNNINNINNNNNLNEMKTNYNNNTQAIINNHPYNKYFNNQHQYDEKSENQKIFKNQDLNFWNFINEVFLRENSQSSIKKNDNFDIHKYRINSLLSQYKVLNTPSRHNLSIFHYPENFNYNDEKPITFLEFYCKKLAKSFCTISDEKNSFINIYLPMASDDECVLYSLVYWAAKTLNDPSGNYYLEKSLFLLNQKLNNLSLKNYISCLATLTIFGGIYVTTGNSSNSFYNLLIICKKLIEFGGGLESVGKSVQEKWLLSIFTYMEMLSSKTLQNGTLFSDHDYLMTYRLMNHRYGIDPVQSCLKPLFLLMAEIINYSKQFKKQIYEQEESYSSSFDSKTRLGKEIGASKKKSNRKFFCNVSNKNIDFSLLNDAFNESERDFKATFDNFKLNNKTIRNNWKFKKGLSKSEIFELLKKNDQKFIEFETRIDNCKPSKEDLLCFKNDKEFEEHLMLFELFQLSLKMFLLSELKYASPNSPQIQYLLIQINISLDILIDSAVKPTLFLPMTLAGFNSVSDSDRISCLKRFEKLLKNINPTPGNGFLVKSLVEQSWKVNPHGSICLNWYELASSNGLCLNLG
ncbi:Zn(II)2Cys6 transcription factor ASCRUDRAFT_5300 [Ascoidea rubescens DSM 1968]|uniref:Zn(2)-C6 fungal-type domain-containing protein n=1 Tax=Ascoidea rubescens DSM 1968 TaxID=1344418 RepID=A0A1D2VNU4_9ASCO|nr:hypothetical protein ASCRUDRAFT_5300 [Ascoidea rubescens DSM 1968]ODV63269.1 hypothetical protein ASCRUDRAFT_5300 [Ascoidea rubescens DSM 1968]